MNKILDELESISIENPSDIIIRQIRELIKDGRLEPGDKLPSEAALQKKFLVKRGVVREALKKLEFYGILKTIPQSGTVVANLGPQALEGLLSNILKLEKNDYESLIDTRMVLEGHAAALAATRANTILCDELEELEQLYEKKVQKGERGLNADICFHLKIAEAANSSVLSSLITMISPDILSMFYKLNRTSKEKLQNTIDEHSKILLAIKDKKPREAEEAMRDHINRGYKASKK
jgi:GntR family transcriptional regulator, transcriptional repressor for pyruvate dehydrogenase complex